MAIDIGPAPPAWTGEGLEALRGISVSILADELGRRAVLDPAIAPIAPPVRFAGPALTIECVAGDISAVLYGLERLERGQVAVVNARGHRGTAIWGEIMQSWARQRGAAGVVIDGAVRDSEFLRGSGLPIHARSITARGPQASGEGTVNRTISCGGVPVAPGAIVVGDVDGIVIVSPDDMAGLAERCHAREAFEAEIIAAIAAGGSPRAMLGLPDAP